MKKQLFTLFSIAVISASSTAQEQQKVKGTWPIPCNTYAAMEDVFNADPNAKTRYNLVQSQLETEYRQEILNQATKKVTAAPIYTIPVVFHVLHQNGPEDISDASIIAAVAQINSDYSKLGSDTTSINSNFSSLYVKAQIQLALAQKDPNGNCTNGIIHHYDANTNWDQTNSAAYAYSGSGTNRWPSNKYLNVYIVKCIASSTSPCPPTGGFIVGYTYVPGTWGTNASQDAIVYRYDFLTGLNARSLSHEMGHWFNLTHTFGNTNNPGTVCGDDGVTDTPVTMGYFSTCPGGNAGPYTGCTAVENMENFMDYSSCPRMFTQLQVTKMRSALVSTTSGRNNLWTTTNLNATGLNGTYTCSPLADFKANKLAVCAGNTFTYTSSSQLGATGGGISWTFQGGSPATSTSTSQVVSYATPGTYSVSLTATNTTGTNTMNKTSYVTVVNGASGILAPTLYNFEGATLPSSVTVTNGNAGSVTWVQNTATGGNTTAKSIYINNASSTSTPGHIDIFQTPIYDFSTTSGVALSYYYAYAKRLATQVDSFRIQYSLDCGGTWVNIAGVPTTAAMATASGGTTTTAFVPTSAQWIAKTIVTGLFPAVNNKPSVMFRFYFRSDDVVGRSNNIYLDQINITGNVVVTSISELEKSIGLVIYPNPTSSSSILDFTILNNQSVKITVVDLMGRVLEENMKTSSNDGHVSYTINQNGTLASGVYIVNIDVNNQRISKKLIIE
jgi:PKD repeat protein